MSIKNILALSILLSVFIVAVFSYPYIVYWIHSDESVQTAKVLLVVGLVLLGIGLCAANSNVLYEAMKEKEFIEEVAEKVIDRQEMLANAEKALTKDQQAKLRMLRNNTQYKIDIKV